MKHKRFENEISEDQKLFVKKMDKTAKEYGDIIEKLIIQGEKIKRSY